MIPFNDAVVLIHRRLFEPVHRVAGCRPLDLNPLNIAFPAPRISRGSELDRKLPPAPFSRENTFPPMHQRIVAPAAAGLDLVARKASPSQLLPDTALFIRMCGGPPFSVKTTSG